MSEGRSSVLYSLDWEKTIWQRLWKEKKRLLFVFLLGVGHGTVVALSCWLICICISISVGCLHCDVEFIISRLHRIIGFGYINCEWTHSWTFSLKKCFSSDLTVTIWPGSRWTPFIWAMKMAATASYRAVPSMLMVAPTGSTKRVTLLSIPKFSSRHRKVTGSVPALDKNKIQQKQETINWVIISTKRRYDYWFTHPLMYWPWGCAQSSDPGLKDAQEEGERVFPSDGEVNAGQEDGSVDDEANNHSYHIHAKLPCYHLQVLNGDDFATDQTCNTKRGVPDGLKRNKKLKTFIKWRENIFLCCNNWEITIQLVISDRSINWMDGSHEWY